MPKKNGRTAKRIRKILRPFVSPNFADNAGVQLPLKHPLISAHIAKEIYFGTYESKEIDIVSQRLASSDVVMEVGAGIGFLSAYCAQRIGNDRVHAYEANPALRAVIDMTYSANHVKPNVYTALLAQGNGERTFYVEKEFWASTTVSGSTGAQAITVPQIDLNSEITRIRPTFLILDIEGGEAEFIPLADLSGIQKICIETHPHVLGNNGVTKILAHLFAQGFSLDFGLVRKNVFYLYRV